MLLFYAFHLKKDPLFEGKEDVLVRKGPHRSLSPTKISSFSCREHWTTLVKKRVLFERREARRLVYLPITQISIFSINCFKDSVHVPLRLSLSPLYKKWFKTIFISFAAPFFLFCTIFSDNYLLFFLYLTHKLLSDSKILLVSHFDSWMSASVNASLLNLNQDWFGKYCKNLFYIASCLCWGLQKSDAILFCESQSLFKSYSSSLLRI